MAQKQAPILRTDPRCEPYHRETVGFGVPDGAATTEVIKRLTEVMTAAAADGWMKDDGRV